MRTHTGFWHGGPALRGDMILPPSVTGVARVCDGDPFVYITPRRHLALTYASTCNGWLYEVEPVGVLEQDPDSALPAGVSLRCPAARIIRRFKPSNAEMAEVAEAVSAAYLAWEHVA